MLPQEIRDIIEKEAELKFPDHPFDLRRTGKQDGYFEGATKYAELMIEFADWVHDNYFGVHQYKGGWKWMKLGGSASDLLPTSDLLTIFLKEKSKS